MITDHYEFANALFYAIADTLFPTPPASRVQPERTPRTYLSRYVGVTPHRAGWVAMEDKRHTHRTEEEAAWARARALGRDWLEERAPEQVRTQEPSTPLDARGHATRPLGGRRIA